MRSRSPGLVPGGARLSAPFIRAVVPSRRSHIMVTGTARRLLTLERVL